ncbi:MAG: adenosylmethionine decarboxylase [Cocleimonas sp.]
MIDSHWPSFVDKNLLKKQESDIPQDLFTCTDGLSFAGTHLILDGWGASHLDDIDHIETALRDAIKVSGATLLHIHLHHFTPNGGVSGVAVLAESHISIHTWPERDFVALDIFMCGDTQPEKAIPIFEKAFKTQSIDVSTHLRGVVASSDSLHGSGDE